MINSQQDATWRYFSNAATEWRKKAEGAIPARVNTIKQRNDFVLSVAQRIPSLKYSLDVGCGTGELVCDLAKTGVKAVGVDFAEEMIALSREKAARENLPQATFVHASIFEYDRREVKFDLISANGFVEYISRTQLQQFMAHAKSLLGPGGSLVLGSRNRLFNLFSLNDFTRIEFDCGALDALVRESMLFAGSASVEELFAQLRKETNSLPAIENHPRTGVDVSTRNQYTPGELIRLMVDEGFTVREICPIHYHPAGPRFAREHPETHVEFANLMQVFGAECHYLVPYASSFMLHAQAS